MNCWGNDPAALGSILIPAMEKDGYDKTFSAAVTASSSVIGPIIPPSIPVVIFALVGSVSVGGLFLAGVVPGVLICHQTRPGYGGRVSSVMANGNELPLQ